MKELKQKIRIPLIAATLLLGLIWSIKGIEVLFDIPLTGLGIYPREFRGLLGVITSPLIHDFHKFDHILSNSVPLFVLIFALYFWYRKLASNVLVWVWVITGIWVWVGGRNSWHVGASGIIYGLVSFLFVSGVVRKSKQAMAVSLLVVLLYGSMFWGIFPLYQNVSWESHLAGSIAGILMAFYYKKERIFSDAPKLLKPREQFFEVNYSYDWGEGMQVNYTYKEKRETEPKNPINQDLAATEFRPSTVNSQESPE